MQWWSICAGIRKSCLPLRNHADWKPIRRIDQMDVMARCARRRGPPSQEEMTKKTMTGAMRILASMLVAAALATARLLLTPAAILVLFAALPAQTSDDWNTAAFFQQATPAAVQERSEAGGAGRRRHDSAALRDQDQRPPRGCIDAARCRYGPTSAGRGGAAAGRPCPGQRGAVLNPGYRLLEEPR